MIPFGLGWLKDGPGSDPPAHGLLAARRSEPTVAPLDTPDLRQFARGIHNQGPTSACVAFATCYALDRYYRANGHTDVPRTSERAVYWCGRAEEYAGQNPEFVRTQIDDTGSYPRLVLEAVRQDGFVAWDVCPFPEDDATLGSPEAMRELMRTQPPPAVWTEAYDQRGLRYARPEDNGPVRVAAVMEALYYRLGVAFGLRVDEAFMQNRGQIVDRIAEGSIVGGHMLCADRVFLDPRLPRHVRARLEHIAREARDAGQLAAFCAIHLAALRIGGPNSWGRGFGQHGYFEMTAELFASEYIGDVTILQFAPWEGLLS